MKTTSKQGNDDRLGVLRGLRRGEAGSQCKWLRRAIAPMAPQCLLIVAVLSAIMPFSAVYAGNIVINSADTSVVNEMFTVTADMEFHFSDDALEALQSGVALYIEFDVRVKRQRAYIWDKKLLTLSKRVKIERHALTERFVITDLVTEERRIFESIAAALDGLSTVADIPVAPQNEFTDGEFGIELRARLDIEALPAPMRPIAYISPAWRMSSGWYRWNLAR